jgi:tRNA dimethylallyltransferase
LIQRIDERVDAMFASGWVEEVRRLVADPRGLSRSASQAVGYREIIAYLQIGGSLRETIGAVKTRTRQFAKRQMTWFRSLSECQFVEVRSEDSPWSIAERVLAAASMTNNRGEPPTS